MCLLFVFPLAAHGQEPSPDWTVDNFRKSEILAPETAIEVLNPYGDVRLRSTTTGEVEVSAQIQRRKSDPVQPEVNLVRRRGRLRIEVGYPVPPRGDLHRVDIAVIVPAGARVSVDTEDGMIQANGLESDVDLESAGGNITLSTSGTARVSAGRGDITAELRGDDWGRSPPRFETRDGNVTLTLPKNADARVRVSTDGEIALRRTGRVERQTPHKAVFAFGNGTHSLTIKSRRGRVIVLAPAH